MSFVRRWLINFSNSTSDIESPSSGTVSNEDQAATAIGPAEVVDESGDNEDDQATTAVR